jgi:hypothetical protein
MCTVLLPPGVNPVAINKYININLMNGTIFENKKNKYGAGTLRFPTREGTSPKITPMLTPPKNIRQLCPRPEKFEEFRFKERYNISVPGAPICLGPALEWTIIVMTSVLIMLFSQSISRTSVLLSIIVTSSNLHVSK